MTKPIRAEGRLTRSQFIPVRWMKRASGDPRRARQCWPEVPFGPQIHRFAKDLAALGYVTAVPRYYVKDPAEPTDSDAVPHVPTLTDAIAHVAKRKDVDPDRLSLVGYSLGAATSMTYIASNPAGKVKVLIDFFGPNAPMSFWNLFYDDSRSIRLLGKTVPQPSVLRRAIRCRETIRSCKTGRPHRQGHRGNHEISSAGGK